MDLQTTRKRRFATTTKITVPLPRNNIVQSLENAESFARKDYKAPSKSDGYLTLVAGENRIRILSPMIEGWQEWIDKKPVRYRYNEKPSKPVDAKDGFQEFWAFVVWSYAESKIKIFMPTQATIKKELANYSSDLEWGNPYFYDMKINKIVDKAKDKTSYVVIPCKPAPVSELIKRTFAETPINLDALFVGEDPFNSELF